MAASVLAQGTVNTANTTPTAMRTNALAWGPFGTTGNTAPTPGGFYYELLTAPSTVTSVDSSLQGLLSAPWSDTGLRMTNSTTFLPGGRVNGPSGAAGIVNHWPAGQMNSYIVVGWSANEGTTWAQVAARMQGLQFLNDGYGYYFETGGAPLAVNGGFLGASTIQQAQAGQPDGTGPFSLFGSTGGVQGTPITTPTDLYAVFNGPEPSSVALAGLAFAIFVLRRRRAIC